MRDKKDKTLLLIKGLSIKPSFLYVERILEMNVASLISGYLSNMLLPVPGHCCPLPTWLHPRRSLLTSYFLFSNGNWKSLSR